MQNLKKLFERLLENKIDFILVGGFAGVVHGSTQVTQDIDICLSIDSKQIEKLRVALKDLNPRHRMNPSFKPSFLDYPKDIIDTKNIYLETDWGILDIMSEIPPIGDFNAIKKNATELSIFGFTSKVISLDDLIRVKEQMNRPKDKAVLAELLAVRNKLKKT